MGNLSSRKDSKGRVLRKGEYERKNGTYEYRYTEDGQRYSIYEDTLKSLREKENIINRNILLGIKNSKQEIMTVSDLVVEYLNTKRKLDAYTKCRYHSLWELHIQNSKLGKKKVENVTKKDIMDFYDTFSKTKDGDTVKQSGLIYNLQQVINPAFEYAVDTGVVFRNPARGIFKNYKIEINERDALTEEQQLMLLNFLKNDRFYCKYYHMVIVILGTGLRLGEILGLTWSEIDFKNKVIHKEHQLQYRSLYGNGMQFMLKPPKTKAGIRTIPMSEDVYHSLQIQKKTWQRTVDALNGDVLKVDGHDDFVFITDKGKPYEPNTLDRTCKKVAELANSVSMYIDFNGPMLPLKLSSHILRHTACTRMAETGMDLKVLQYIMGHSTPNVTLSVYNHVHDNRVERERDKLNNIVSLNRISC